jgi:DNA-binding XRE family transcriptional regulator
MSASPAPDEIKAARKAAGLTQAAAAALVHLDLRTWQACEAPEGKKSHRKLHPGLWELFRIKTVHLRGD